MGTFTCWERKTPAPGLGWRITTISTFMAKILLTVSMSVSPFFTEDCAAEKLITSAESLFSASSKDRRVRVLFSKNKLAIVISLREGTFLIGRLMTSLNWSAVVKISSISSAVRYLIPNRWLTLSWFIVMFFRLWCGEIILFLWGRQHPHCLVLSNILPPVPCW